MVTLIYFFKVYVYMYLFIYKELKRVFKLFGVCEMANVCCSTKSFNNWKRALGMEEKKGECRLQLIELWV